MNEPLPDWREVFPDDRRVDLFLESLDHDSGPYRRILNTHLEFADVPDVSDARLKHLQYEQLLSYLARSPEMDAWVRQQPADAGRSRQPLVLLAAVSQSLAEHIGGRQQSTRGYSAATAATGLTIDDSAFTELRQLGSVESPKDGNGPAPRVKGATNTSAKGACGAVDEAAASPIRTLEAALQVLRDPIMRWPGPPEETVPPEAPFDQRVEILRSTLFAAIEKRLTDLPRRNEVGYRQTETALLTAAAIKIARSKDRIGIENIYAILSHEIIRHQLPELMIWQRPRKNAPQFVPYNPAVHDRQIPDEDVAERSEQWQWLKKSIRTLEPVRREIMIARIVDGIGQIYYSLKVYLRLGGPALSHEQVREQRRQAEADLQRLICDYDK
ncbi:MAG: hypothetical protein JNK76_07300 [Planctomycetales bacterium]|nr:hypothetical protein [Planctomycetales bacterium]MBN8628270.1 hypothetical protein [Planctomycetota bacterium]